MLNTVLLAVFTNILVGSYKTEGGQSLSSCGTEALEQFNTPAQFNWLAVQNISFNQAFCWHPFLIRVFIYLFCIVLIWFSFYINRDLSVVNSTLNFYVATRGLLLDVEWDEEYLRRCGSHTTEGECGTEIYSKHYNHPVAMIQMQQFSLA